MSGVRTRRFALATLPVVALLSCGIVSAQVYRWKDASGNTHYTDTPPPTSAKDYRTVSPAEPNAPRDPRTLPRHAPATPIATRPSVPAATVPIDRTLAPADVQRQVEENRKYLRAQQNDKARKEQALLDARQCTEWYKALDRIEKAEKEAGPQKRNASERKDLSHARAELKRNIAGRCG
ncbi:uncharacterized protein DUF4124 [Luteimonas cucumeris]|uniref:Uncharacterized protein DUF4124 n=1 Tax=Luteimonas cucumeris TaxID=985012 RepID=A0A562L856_9GAMM|nr:DUF4124 domain-containing protein [Luteimonas cucumeris]TWI03813.1 uncharacterized protein DUF4124 [Luteimonas cucumeris]